MNENIPEDPISSTAQKVRELRKQQRSHSWLQRYQRPTMAAISTLGLVITAYLTFVSFSQSSVACPTNACDIVLTSPYAKVFGLPLSLFCCLGYASMIAFAIAPILVTDVTWK